MQEKHKRISMLLSSEYFGKKLRIFLCSMKIIGKAILKGGSVPPAGII